MSNTVPGLKEMPSCPWVPVLSGSEGTPSRKVPDVVVKAKSHTSSPGMALPSPILVLRGRLPPVARPPYVAGKGLQQPESPGQANLKVPKLSTSIKCSDLVRLLPEES